jgi:hypothetical protein
MLPRSLFVFENPCLEEYAVGYASSHQPFHDFDYATRLAKDYRIELLFACVEVDNSKLLREATALTDYANSRLVDGHSRLLPTTPRAADQRVSTDDVIERLKKRAVVTGEEAKADLGFSVGRNARSVKVMSSKSRIDELKARHEKIHATSDGSGHSPVRAGGQTVLQGKRK